MKAQNLFVTVQSTDRFQLQAAYLVQLGASSTCRCVFAFSTLKSELLLVKSESVIVMQLGKMKWNGDRFYVTIHAFDISMMIPFPDHTACDGWIN